MLFLLLLRVSSCNLDSIAFPERYRHTVDFVICFFKVPHHGPYPFTNYLITQAFNGVFNSLRKRFARSTFVFPARIIFWFFFQFIDDADNNRCSLQNHYWFKSPSVHVGSWIYKPCISSIPSSSYSLLWTLHQRVSIISSINTKKMTAVKDRSYTWAIMTK